MKNAYMEKPWMNHYPAGVPGNVEVPTLNVCDAFNQTTEKFKNKTAINFYGNKITYGALRDKVDRCATAFHKLGIQKGDRIALLLLNSPEFITAFYACAKVGAVITPISPVYVSSEIKHQLLDSGASHLICQDILYEGVEKTGVELKNIILTNIADSLPKVKKMIGKSILRGVYQKMSAPSPEIYRKESFHQLQDLVKEYPPNPPEVSIDPKKDLMALPYTGGTTGAPKGVMIAHCHMMWNFNQISKFMPSMEEGKETVVAFMPYYHAAGQGISVLYSILRGYMQVTVTTPDIDDIIMEVIKQKATFFMGSPTIYETLKDYKKTDRVKWKRLKLIISGADSLHDYTAKDWEDRTGSKITEGYGMTETTSTTHMNPIGRERYGSIGIPLPDTLAAILDPDKDEFMPVGEMGELVVAGEQITHGYWKQPEATEDCVAEIDGVRWWRTGDLARMEEDGYFYIYDRKRDLIKYKGLRVFAREVEEALKTHPKIKEVGVVGVPDPKVGSQVKAVIVLESDARGKISERDVTEYCQDKLAHYKIPKIIEFAGEIPKTDIGKVSRREIRESVED
ncbi:MAG: AMP-binding protein [Desulfatiglans sp.]|nr:AMP-binding protein [Desulfatiglans sp.]